MLVLPPVSFASIAAAVAAVALSALALVFASSVRDKQCAAKKLAPVPGPDGLFLLGFLPELAKHQHRMLYYLEELMIKYGGRVKLPWNLFRDHIVFLSDPADVEYVLSTNMSNWIKSDLFLAAIKEVFGLSLFGINHGRADGGAKFRAHRKVITRVFTTNNFRKFTEDSFAKYAKAVVNVVKQQNGRCNMHTVASQFALQTIFDIAFGLPLQSFDESLGVKFIESMDFVFKTLSERIFLKPYFRYFWWCMPSEYRFKRETKVMLDLADSILQQRLLESESELAQRSDMLSLLIVKSRELIAAGEATAIDEPWLRSSTTSLLFAGRDTMSATLLSVFYMLAQHPQEQDKILAELEGVDTTAMTYEDVKSLKYLDAFVWETLRLYPSAPYAGKTAAEDDVLPDGTFIPAGTEATINIYYMGRNNAKLWGDDQLTFRPERWLEMKTRPSAYEYPVFVGGPRICPGMNMALLQTKFFVAVMLREFHVRIQDGEQLENRPYIFGATLEMVGGLPLQFTPREAAVGAS